MIKLTNVAAVNTSELAGGTLYIEFDGQPMPPHLREMIAEYYPRHEAEMHQMWMAEGMLRAMAPGNNQPVQSGDTVYAVDLPHSKY